MSENSGLGVQEFISRAEQEAWTKYQSGQNNITSNLVSLISKNGQEIVKSDAIIDTLRHRYKLKYFYTSIGNDTLLLVNPYEIREQKKQLKQLFEQEHDARNLSQEFAPLPDDEKSLIISDPRTFIPVLDKSLAHVFTFASRAYWHMLRDGMDQVILLQGESGSGKTFTSHLLIRQLVNLSHHSSRILGYSDQSPKFDVASSKIVQRLYGSFAILESFSNAATNFNPSSSRVHKTVELRFSKHGKLTSVDIVALSLEKQRVTMSHQWGRNEMNFNIFYEFLKSDVMSKEEKERFCLHDGVYDYDYLREHTHASSLLKKTYKYQTDLKAKNIRSHLKAAGFKARLQEQIFTILSAIMLLGNIKFEINKLRMDQGAYVKTWNELDDCAHLLGVSSESLATALTQRTRVINQSVFADFLSVKQSQIARDRLAFTLYGLLFDFIVKAINIRLKAPARTDGKQVWKNCIKMFDYAGLEDHGWIKGDTSGSNNRFWQFTTNYADETILQWSKQLTFSGSIEDIDIVRKVAPEIHKSIRSVMDCYNDSTWGLVPALSRLTIKTDISEAEDQNIDFILQSTRPIFDSNGKRMERGQAVQKPKDVLLAGHKKGSFGIRHYGGTSLTKYKTEGGHHSCRIYYDLSDFVITNKAGGYGEMSEAVSTELLRLVRGTVDFKTSKNDFLHHLIEIYRGLSDIGASINNVSTSTGQLNSNGELTNHYMNDGSIMGGFDSAFHEDIGDIRPHKQDKTVTITTAIDRFQNDIKSSIRSINGKTNRTWFIYMIKPNDEFADNRFHEDKIRTQIKRFDIGCVILQKSLSLDVKISITDFWNRYKCLAGIDKQQSTVAEKCYQICSLYATVFRGGNGRTSINDNDVFLDRSAYWSLERNLLAYEISLRQGKISGGDRFDPELVNSDVEDYIIQSPIDAKENDESVLKDIQKAALYNRLRKSGHKENILSSQRWWWLLYVYCVTWWIPEILLQYIGRMKHPDVRLAWREKVAICILFFIISAAVVFIISGIGPIFCPEIKQYFKTEIQSGIASSWIVINGQIFDLSGLQHPQIDIKPYYRSDVSVLFPTFDTREGSFGELPKSCLITMDSSNFGTIAPKCKLDSNTEFCHDTNTFYQKIRTGKSRVKFVGTVSWSISDVKMHDKNSDSPWVIINKKVYDLSAVKRPTIPLPQSEGTTLLALAGGDASQFANSFKSSGTLNCLDDMFFLGVLDERNSPVCVATQYVLISLTAIITSVIAVKFLSSLQLTSKRRPEDQDRFCILLVPCYTEGEDSLKKTINSLAVSEYEDTKKLLFVVSDGLVKGSGNDRMTPEIVLDIFGIENGSEYIASDDVVNRFEYVSLGVGSSRINRAKIFSGVYNHKGHLVPFIVVVKCGKMNETRRPGNRGKRDSQLILMKFLSKAFNKGPMSPLELELYKNILINLGVQPEVYEYCLMVDADTEVQPDALNRLITSMLSDQRVMGLCGETAIGNPTASWVSMIQVYEYWMSHHMSKAFESLFGNGCFCMYRIKSSGKRPIALLVNENVITQYEDNNVDTLHKKNLLSLGEDRYLTTLLLKEFPSFRTKFSRDAVCQTIVPDTFDVLLSQRRRWINSTVHNLWELLKIRQLCGCMCFSMRAVIFFDLIGTIVMPASLAYMGYMFYLLTLPVVNQYVFVSLLMLGAVYGMQAIVFLLRKKFDMIGWLFINLLATPIMGFVLPLYAFWHFDDFSWGNTRVAVGEGQVKSGDGVNKDDELQEEMKLKTWDEYAENVLEKRKEKDTGDSRSTNVFKSNSLTATTNTETVEKLDTQNPRVIVAKVPIGPKSPFLEGFDHKPYIDEVGTNSLETQADELKGIPATLLPLPQSIHPAIARFILREMNVILEKSDLKSLTKRIIREQLEEVLIKYIDTLQRRVKLTLDDQILIHDTGDLSRDPSRRDWVSKCIFLLLMEKVQ